MTQDEVVAFPLSDPAVLVRSNPGHRTLWPAQDAGPKPIDMTGWRDAFSAKSFARLSAQFYATSWWLEERPRVGCARPPCVCWPPLKPGLSAL